MAKSSIRIELKGAARARRALDKTAGAMEKAAELAVWDATRSIQARIKRSFGEAGKPRVGNTGMLRRGVVAPKPEKRGRFIIGTVGVLKNVPYAAIHEFGGRTSAHQIFPRRKRALRWIGGTSKLGAFAALGMGVTRNQAFGVGSSRPGSVAESGDEVFAKSVKHPGSNIPARPYMRPGLEAERPLLQGKFRKRVAEAIKQARA